MHFLSYLFVGVSCRRASSSSTSAIHCAVDENEYEAAVHCEWRRSLCPMALIKTLSLFLSSLSFAASIEQLLKSDCVPSTVSELTGETSGVCVCVWWPCSVQHTRNMQTFRYIKLLQPQIIALCAWCVQFRLHGENARMHRTSSLPISNWFIKIPFALGYSWGLVTTHTRTPSSLQNCKVIDLSILCKSNICALAAGFRSHTLPHHLLQLILKPQKLYCFCGEWAICECACFVIHVFPIARCERDARMKPKYAMAKC